MSWLVIGTNESANSIRLSGAVDLTGFPSLTVFNCIFVIDLD